MKPIIIAMALYIVIHMILPKLITRPTGIGPLDELVMTTIAQRESLMSGTILIGLIVFATNYIEEEFF
jgi:hypothetical protein